MKKVMLLLMLPCVFMQVKGADGDYAVSKIAPALLVNAYAVKRYEEIRFDIININRATYYRKVAYTILNEKGDKFARCLELYDKLRSVEYIEGKLFDESGKKIKSLKKGDIQDRSGTDGGTLADDDRIKFHSFYYKVYPYTVEYETEIKYNYTMFYPRWVPQDDGNLSVELSKIDVALADGFNLRYKAFNVGKEPVVNKQKGTTTYTWEATALPAIEEEYASPSWYEIAPVVSMAPVRFSVQGYEGDMSSWKDLGKFVQALKAGRDQLPDDIKTKVHALTDGVTDTGKKVALLYDLLQKSSRYISVQLGIGGWQPFDAKYVAANRYGDCKALVNYMYSLLKEAGIKSYYTLVKSGVDNVFFISDFPSSSQFDHVILSVPVRHDTLWLECTSQTLPPGYLSGFTCDRYALMIDDAGGTLVRTPHYGIADNLQVRNIKAVVDAEGRLNSNVVTVYKARQEDQVHSLINTYSKDKVMEYLKQAIDLPYYDVVSFNYTEAPSALPSITETLQLTATDYAQVSGKRLFISPNILSKTSRKLLPDDTRKYAIDLHYEYKDVDSVALTIPAGYEPESVPGDVHLESRFGKYNATIKVSGNQLIYIRTMEQFSGRFAAVEYNSLVQFCDKIYKADRNKVVFVKKG